MLAGGSPRSPAPTARWSSPRRAKDSRKAGQCSRSSAWRTFSPSRAARRPHAPSQTASFQASRSCIAGISSQGSEVASSRWSKPPVACSSSQAHSFSSSMERLPGSSTLPARESMTTRRLSPRSAAEAPAHSVGLAVGPDRELAQQRAGVVDLVDAAKQLVVGELRRAQVADVLVDPVRHQGPDDVLVPQRPGAHLVRARSWRCSSRRGRRGRRRSSPRAGWRAASG